MHEEYSRYWLEKHGQMYSLILNDQLLTTNWRYLLVFNLICSGEDFPFWQQEKLVSIFFFKFHIHFAKEYPQFFDSL